jgi:PAS domain S-box-containing protein
MKMVTEKRLVTGIGLIVVIAITCIVVSIQQLQELHEISGNARPVAWRLTILQIVLIAFMLLLLAFIVQKLRLDYTRRKETELQLKQLNEQLQLDIEAKAAGEAEAKQAMLVTEEKYKTLFYKSPIPMWIYDFITLRFLEVNEAAVAQYGYSMEEFTQMTLRDIRPHEDMEGFMKNIETINARTDKQKNIWQHKKKNGDVIQVEVTALPIDYNHYTARLVVINDISEKLRAQAKLSRERNLLRIIIDNVPDYIYVKDLQFNYIMNNRAMVELVDGKLEKETTGKNVYDLFGEEVGRINMEEDRKIVRTGEGVLNREEAIVNNEGKSRWLLTSKVPLKDDKNKILGLIGISRDITSRIQTEMVLKKMHEDLQRRTIQLAATNAELEQFVYIASHDLQEPLRTTSGFVGLLKDEYAGKLDETADEYLGFILQSTERMKRLIKDLLDYSRIGRKNELQPVNCNELLREVTEDMGMTMKETGTIIQGGDLPVLTGYRTELKLLFQNLVSNAIKFRKKDVQPLIQVTAWPIDNNGWQFAMHDNGIGIREEHKERVFVIFQRLHNRDDYDGSGIGLAHCKKIVELHGGKIWLTSKETEGTTFYWTISKMDADPVHAGQNPSI